MKLMCDWEISGQGNEEICLSELDDLSPEAVETWLMDNVAMEITEQGNYQISLRPRYDSEDLAHAIAEEKAIREENV